MANVMATSPEHLAAPQVMETDSETMPIIMRAINQHSMPQLFMRHEADVKAPITQERVPQEVSAIEQLRELQKDQPRQHRRPSYMNDVRSFMVKRHHEPTQDDIVESAEFSANARVDPADRPDPAHAFDDTENAAHQSAHDGVDCDAGMLWIIKNNKMIVSGFEPGSIAPRKGVKPGDILRSVDKQDILSMRTDEYGHHEGEELLLGPMKSTVQLTFLRVAKPKEGETISSTPLLEYHVTLPRSHPVGD